MPLLNRKPFSSDPPPSDLSENEEIFVCRQTNEVYRDYESFFKRTILCNSLVWSCKVTLKHSLTYEEALDSEQEAQKVVDHVSTPIQQGVLTLVHYTRHSRLDNLCDEVYNYIRDRYQEGEEIEVKYKGEKFLGYIHKVIEPNSLTNGFGSNTSSPMSKQNATKKISSPHIKNKSGKSSNLSSPNKPGGSIIVLSDDENQSNNKEKTPALPSPSSPKASSTWPDSKRYQYEVRLKDNKNTPVKTPESITAKYSDISRKKRTFSRDKLKLLLRVTCCRSTALSDDGYWRVKDEYRKKFDLSSDVDLVFQNMPVKKKNKKRKSDNLAEMNGKSDSKKRKKSEEKDKKKKSEGKEDKSIKDKNKKEKMLKKMSPEEIEKYKLEMKIQQEKKKEERKREKDVQREVKRKEREKERQEKRELLREQRLSLLHWCIPQEDLDLGDLKELPIPVPVQCKFSGDMFGSIVMVLEFLHTFGEFFEMKQDFPDGVSIEMLEEALQEHDAEGMFYDILKFLLQCILKTHAEEEEEEGLDDSDVQAHDETEDRKMEEEDEEESDLTRLKKAVSSSASMAAAWAQLYQGKNLHELTLDPFTCSEILRLHILSSGARLVSGSDGDTYRWQRRGGFTFADDAGVAFRHHEHGIMRALVTNNVYDLDTADKLKILSTLCSQLLTYATTRDIIDDGIDRSRKAKRELQEEQWADQRKDKEEAAAKYRKRVEEKAKEREEKEKKLTESKSETPENSKEKIPKQESSNQEDEQTLKELEEDNLSKAITRSQAPPVAEEEMANDENEEERERETRKELLKKREKSFLKEIRKSQAMSGLQPIGIDRGFRRYWLFSSINGLFIEDNDSELNKLLQPKVNDELSEEDGSDGDSSVLENIGENALGDVSGDIIDPLSNSKESSNIPLTSSCSLTKTQIQEEKELSRILKLYSIPLESLPENSPLSSQAELGEKREENCEKLMTRNIAQWSYLDKKEDFDKLIDTLNPRGIREKSLREALVQHYKMIVNGLNENPVRVENHERNEALQQQIRARKKRAGLRNQPQGVIKTLYKSMEDFIEANLRDQILDLEDRIWQGGLGSVKTEDITAWRKKVENCIYDFIPAAAATETPNEESEISVNGMDVDGQESETMEVDEKKEAKSTVHEESLNTKTCKLNILPSFENSRPGTPVDGSFASTPTTSHTPQAINPYVRLLAKAVLEVEQGIERKYLIPPLGDDEETKKRKQQEASEAARMEFDEMMVAATAAAAAGKKKKDKIAKNDVTEAEKQENGNNDVSPKTEQVAKQQKTLLERWEDSLMASTNLSQVFIHLTNLDNCISWNKSVLNARCRICRRKGDAEHMLLCDGCDRGHHMYCLKPPIKEIPEGDWFCSDCRPKEPRRSFRKTRKVEESDEESGDEDKTSFKREEVEESNGDEDEDDDSSEEEEEDSVEESDDEENEEDEEDEEDEEMDEVEGSEEEGSVHMETCACCDGGGELLCCETCPLAYHLECAYPPLRRVPRGSWACQVCTGADSELPAGRKIKKSVIKTAQKRVNDREVLPKVPTKTSKTSTKEIVTMKVVKKPTTLKPKLQTSNTNTPSPVVASQSRKTLADVRINKRKIATPPQASSTPSGQSNSAPKRTGNAKWPGQVKMCRKLLKELTEHEDSWPFLYPVDQTEVPDYSTIVKTPMDLKTIDGKLSSRQYHCVEDFAADVRQIFFNCAEYNKPRTREARAGVRLSALFETRFGELGLDASDNKPSRTRRSR